MNLMKSPTSLRWYFSIIGLYLFVTSVEGVVFGTYASKVAPSAISAALGIVLPLIGATLGAFALYLAFALPKYLYPERLKIVSVHLMALRVYVICALILSPSAMMLIYTVIWLFIAWDLNGRVKKYVEIASV